MRIVDAQRPTAMLELVQHMAMPWAISAWRVQLRKSVQSMRPQWSKAEIPSHTNCRARKLAEYTENTVCAAKGCKYCKKL
jgi:hypothetical protein